MNLHEYQAKTLLIENGVNAPSGEACQSVDAVRDVATRLFGEGHKKLVIKSQIHAGGRGKGVFVDGFKGGVHLCDTVEDTVAKAQAMLGNTLVTVQTGEEGREVKTLLVAAAEEILEEYYLAVLLDRATSRPVVMVSPDGGVDIEEVAAKTPERIFKEWVDPALGLQPYQARRLAKALGLSGKMILRAAQLIVAVYDAWLRCDAAMIEINPLCKVRQVDGSEGIAAVDAKISIEDNALFRQPKIAAMRDLAEESPLEVEAGKYDLNYIKLDGNIACLVNGAGLAMATMDIIQFHGGSPANFLDVGGGASKEQVSAAFKIILSDPSVKAILINIFGGIMDCDVIATGVVAAVRETGLDLPLVVRLEGNNVAAGRKTLSESGIAVQTADSMTDAAIKVVQSVSA